MDIVDRLQNKKRNTTDEEDDALTEIQTLRAKVASVDVLVEALETIATESHPELWQVEVAIKALATYDKLSEVKHEST